MLYCCIIVVMSQCYIAVMKRFNVVLLYYCCDVSVLYCSSVMLYCCIIVVMSQCYIAVMHILMLYCCIIVVMSQCYISV